MMKDDTYSEAETNRRMEDGLRRALTTPHKPNAALKAKPKAKRRKKATRKST
jgi:hypothetical protein